MKNFKTYLIGLSIISFQYLNGQTKQLIKPNSFKLLNERTWYDNYQYTNNQKNSLMIGISNFRNYSNSTGVPELTKHPFEFAIVGEASVGVLFDNHKHLLASSFSFEYLQLFEFSDYAPVVGVRAMQIWNSKQVSTTVYPEIGFSSYGILTLKYGMAVRQSDIITKYSKHLISLSIRPGILLESFRGKWC